MSNENEDRSHDEEEPNFSMHTQNVSSSPPRVTAILMPAVVDESVFPILPLAAAAAASSENQPVTVLGPDNVNNNVDVGPTTSFTGTVTATELLVDAELVPVAVYDYNTPSSTGTLTAEFVSATILKKPELACGDEQNLGIHFCSAGDPESHEIYIDSIDCNSPLQETPLKAGYRLVSINGKNSFDMDAETAEALLCTSVGTLTIVAHNSMANSNCQIVATLVEKPMPESRVGLGVRQTGPRGSLVVTKVLASGLFAHSLLNVGDRVLTINGVDCTHVDAAAAIEIIRQSPKYVTIFTEIQSSVGVVLAAAAERTEATSNIATAVAFDLNEEMKGSTHHFCHCLWMLIISLLVVGLVVYMKDDY